MIKDVKKNMTLSISGENNANPSHYTYTCTFSKLIEHWRSIWYTRTNSTTDPTFPFGFVQVSSIEINISLHHAPI
jgi:sialate O-acetylesterase